MKTDNLHDLIEIRSDIRFVVHTLRLLARDMHIEGGEGRRAFLLTYLSNILDSAATRIFDIESDETEEESMEVDDGSQRA